MLIVLDECDYLTEEDITNIRNIKNEDPSRIRIIAASTPSGKRESYYKWCTFATKSFIADTEYIEKTGKVKYNIVTAKANGYKPNGWTQYYAPSTVNKNLQKINPDTGQSYLDDLRDEFPEYRYAQEVMAEFGEELSGVYQKRFIDAAVKLGIDLNCSYANMKPRPAKGPRILGVDWDKVGAETSLLALEYDNEKKVFVPLDKVSIPRTQFTLTMAVNTIAKMDAVHNFDWIYVDRGYGEMQIEQLHLYGMRNPQTNFQHKVIPVSFSSKIKVRDPYTKKKDEKDVKPFMVNNSVNLFEKGLIALEPNDLQLRSQLEQYRIKAISPNGRPTYTDENEHYIDAMNLALLGFAMHYDDMIRTRLAGRIAVIGNLDKDQSSNNALTDLKRTLNMALENDKQDKAAQALDAAIASSAAIKGLGKTSNKIGRTSRSRFVSRSKF